MSHNPDLVGSVTPGEPKPSESVNASPQVNHTLASQADTVRLHPETQPTVSQGTPQPFLVAPPVAPVQSAAPAQNTAATNETGGVTGHPTQNAMIPGIQPDVQTAHFAGADNGSGPQKASLGKTKSLVMGVILGAVVGGLVGAGTVGVLTANGGQSGSSFVSPGSSITVNNPKSVSSVTAVAAAATPSVVTLQVTSSGASGSGSGVIYSEDGYIITNSHVATLSGATSNPDIRVRLSDGTMLDAVLIGTDPFADIAVVKVDAQGLPALPIANSNELNVGEEAVAIGAPLNLSNTVTSGIVSALNRGISVQNSMVPEGAELESQEPQNGENDQSPFPWDFRFEIPQQQQSEQPGQTQTQVSSRVAISVLQTDASINPGNSGGALLNSQGELIGINVALAANGASADTAGSVGLGFAIPSNLAVRVADSLIAGEQPSHGKLGVSVVEASRDTDEDALKEGALIADMPGDSAAARAGMQVGDVITAINGFGVDSSTSASALIRFHEGGEVVSITYSRAGVTDTIDVKLDTLEW